MHLVGLEGCVVADESGMRGQESGRQDRGCVEQLC